MDQIPIKVEQHEAESLPFKELNECPFLDYSYGGQEVTTVEEPNMDDELVFRKLLWDIEREIDIGCMVELKEAYYAAVQEEIKQRTNYIRSKKLLLAFLRAEGFDIPNAAMRLAKFFHLKLELFGREMLPHRIRQSDLNDIEQKIISSGFLHLSEAVDCGGRFVILLQEQCLRSLGTMHPHYRKNISRATFYQMMYVIEQQMQCGNTKQEIVGIRWNFNSTLTMKEYRLLRPFTKAATQILPWKFAAIHNCVNTSMQSIVASLAAKLARRHSQHQIIVHRGLTSAEYFAELSTYGIDVDALSVTINGDTRPEYCKERVAEMRQQEMMSFPPMDKAFHGDFHTSGLQKQECDQERIDFNSADYTMFPETSISLHESMSNQIENYTLESSHHDIFCDKSDIPKSTMYVTNSKREKLPIALMKVLSSNVAPDAIWWVSDGSAVAIKKDLPSHILSAYFDGIKLDSLFRAMSRWGFERLPVIEKSINAGKPSRDILVFQHALFRKNSATSLLSSTELLEKWDYVDGLAQVSTPKGKFLKKIFELLESQCSNKELRAIWWLEDGNEFAIHTVNFSKRVLPIEYNGIQFRSFRRSLRRWGFEQVKAEGNIIVFKHPVFGKNWPNAMSVCHQRKRLISSPNEITSCII